jgi:hypothetical protein
LCKRLERLRDLVCARARERRGIGKRLQERFKHRLRGLRSRTLQEDLRHQHLVGIARVPPGELALISLAPRQELLAKSFDAFLG